VSPGSESPHVFSLGGLNWNVDHYLVNSNVVAEQGLGPWESYDAWIMGGAGGDADSSGDYFYGDMRRPFTDVGMWGLQHVLPADSTTCPIRRVDGSLC
jgi:manganese oxidase